MRKTPKLQDTLEVFYKKLDNVEEELKRLHNVEATVNTKVDELKAVKLSLDLNPLHKWRSDFMKDSSNWKTELYNRFNASISHLDEINKNTVSMLEINRNQLEETNKGRVKRLTNVYILTTIAIIMALMGTYFGIKKDIEGSHLRSRNSTLEYHNSSMFEFINEKELTEEFDLWIDKK